jgi:hypothetical protein
VKSPDRPARVSVPWLGWILFFLLQGCLYLPNTAEPVVAGRGKISEGRTAFLKPSETVREEVLFLLGEPDLVLWEQRILVYRWRVELGLLLFGNQGHTVEREHLLMLEFDDRGRLVRFEQAHSSWWTQKAMAEKIDGWTPPQAEKLLPSSVRPGH